MSHKKNFILLYMHIYVDIHIFIIFLGQNFTYHHQVFLALRKLRCQVQVLLFQKYVVLPEDPLINELNNLSVEWEKVEGLLPSVTCWFLNHL